MKFTFKEKNKVYLLYCNIKIKRFNNKLNYKKLKFFKIEKILKLINYKYIFSILYFIFKINIFKRIRYVNYKN